MSRKRISRNIEVGKYLMLVVGTVTVFAFFNSLGDKEAMGVSSIFLIVSCILFYVFHHAKTVEFDDHFMYVIGKQINEKIPLERIYKIKLTMTQINKSHMWKISSLTERDEVQSVRILPKDTDGSFKEFKAKVKEKNHQVQVKDWSHSFDLDQ